MLERGLHDPRAIGAGAPVAPVAGRRPGVTGRFLRQAPAVAALGVLALLLVLTVVGPVLSGHRYGDLCCAASRPPSWSNPMGTDALGRDMLARILRGVQRSLVVGLGAAAAATFFGVAVGTVAAWFRGWVDELVARSVDLCLTIPELAVLLVLANRASSARDQWLVVSLAIALVSWPVIARVTRGQVLSVSRTGYVDAARATGAPDRRIIVRHVLPNIAGSIVVAATLAVSWAILAESGLSFLGYGPGSPDTSLGTLVEKGADALSTRPWLFYGPGLTLVLLCLCVNYVGDGLRHALDPRAELNAGRRAGNRDQM